MGTTDRRREHGGSKLKTILTLLIFGFLLFSAVKVVPAYFANYQLQDAMQTEARFAITSRKDVNQVREDIWKKVQELDIPAKPDAIRVGYGQGSVEISLDYIVPVDLKVYQFNLEFHDHADNHTI